MRTQLVGLLGCLALAAVAVGPAAGQDQPVKRTELQRVALGDTPGKEGVMYIAEFAPGAVAGKHVHPGDEFGYVVEGTLTIEPEEAEAFTVKEGESFHQLANKPHNGRNGSDSEPAKVLVFLIIPKGEPLAKPVQ
jgi:quercetin dioxygenase-like cupin family protein